MRNRAICGSLLSRVSLAAMLLLALLTLGGCGGGGGGGNNGTGTGTGTGTGNGGGSGITVTGTVRAVVGSAVVQNAVINLVNSSGTVVAGPNLTDTNGVFTISNVPTTATGFTVTAPAGTGFYNVINYKNQNYDFTSTHTPTLPSPLTAGTTYNITANGNFIQIYGSLDPNNGGPPPPPIVP